jgi:D-aspartate ligase
MSSINAQVPYAGIPEIDSQVPIAILGVGITALGSIHCIARRGIPLYVAGATDNLVLRSRWYRPLPGIPLTEGIESRLGASLAALPFGRMVLLPCTDAWAAAVSCLSRDLTERFPASISPPAVIAKFIDKRLFAETLRHAGLPHPRTIFLRGPEDLTDHPERALRGYFVKPTLSRPFAKKYGTKGMRFEGHARTRVLLDEAHALGVDLMLQEYIPGPPTQHYFVEGFVDRTGRICGMLARRRLGMFPREFGNSTSTESIPLADVEPAVETMRALLADVGYRGIFSAEFKLDERDGIFKILEVNARPWWYVEFTANCGLDVCYMAYRDALEKNVEIVDRYRVGRRCVYPRGEVRSRASAPRGERIGFLAMLRSWLGAEQLTLCGDDPKPGLHDLYSLTTTRIRRKLRL